MLDVNVTELRQNLPMYLAKARQGARIRVTLRGQLIAELGPAAPSRDRAAIARACLRGNVVRFDDPLSPAIDRSEWDVNQ